MLDISIKFLPEKYNPAAQVIKIRHCFEMLVFMMGELKVNT